MSRENTNDSGDYYEYSEAEYKLVDVFGSWRRKVKRKRMGKKFE